MAQKFEDRVFIRNQPSVEVNVYPEILDFVFIDANHSYAAVTEDLMHWTPAVKSGGLVAGHDYNGVGDQTHHFGVKRAVDEFCLREKRKVNTAGGYVWWFKK
jgi:predicted O-methyltransferase YrrM